MNQTNTQNKIELREEFLNKFKADGHGFECDGCCVDDSLEKINIFWLNKLDLTLQTYKESLMESVQNFDFKENHICRFNDGKQDCECYLSARKDFINLIKETK